MSSDEEWLAQAIPECAICLEKLTIDNRVLPNCQHTFCMSCLQTMQERNELQNCPECRTPVPPTCILNLPTNVTVNRILEEAANRKRMRMHARQLASEISDGSTDEIIKTMELPNEAKGESRRSRGRRLSRVSSATTSGSSEFLGSSTACSTLSSSTSTSFRSSRSTSTSSMSSSSTSTSSMSSSSSSPSSDESSSENKRPRKRMQTRVASRPSTDEEDSDSDVGHRKKSTKDQKQSGTRTGSSFVTPNKPLPQEFGSRSSERIRQKKNRKVERPTKRKLFDGIDHEVKHRNLEYVHVDDLRPRQWVNDYTKERNYYNRDTDELEANSSDFSFIDDTEEAVDTKKHKKKLKKKSKKSKRKRRSSDISSSEEDNLRSRSKQKTKKQQKKKFKERSASSSEEDNQRRKSKQKTKKQRKKKFKARSASSSADDYQRRKQKTKQEQKNKKGRSASSSSEDDRPHKNCKKVKKLESSSDSYDTEEYQVKSNMP